MTVDATTGLRGLEDISQAAAGGTFSRTRLVNNVSTTGPITKFNASNFPVMATADQTAVTNAGGSATYPGPAITEAVDRIRAHVATIAALRALTTTPTAGQLVIADAGAGGFATPYAWNATSTVADDGDGTVQQTGISTGRWIKLQATAGTIATGGNNAPIMTFQAIGDLNAIGLNIFDYAIAAVSFTISRVVLLCPASAASGTITVDILKQDTSGTGSPTTLYSLNALPTLTCNGGIVWATYTSGAGFPDTALIPAGALICPQLSGTIPAGSYDLRLQIY